MKINDGRTEEGRNEIESRRQFEKFVSMVPFFDANRKKPGDFTKRYGKNFEQLKNLNSNHTNHRFP